MSEYEPGTVAVATVRGVEGVRVMYVVGDLLGSGAWLSSRYVHGGRSHGPGEVTDVRPLVALDLGDNPSYVAKLLRRVVEEDGLGAHTFDYLANQIEAQTKPPKPPEPQGLGAVVEDSEGRRWTRFASYTDAWAQNGDQYAQEGNRPYNRIDAVRVLSKGVTA